MLEKEWTALPRGCLPLPELATPCCQGTPFRRALLSNGEEKGGRQKGGATCSGKWPQSVPKLHALGTCLCIIAQHLCLLLLMNPYLVLKKFRSSPCLEKKIFSPQVFVFSWQTLACSFL